MRNNLSFEDFLRYCDGVGQDWCEENKIYAIRKINEFTNHITGTVKVYSVCYAGAGGQLFGFIATGRDNAYVSPISNIGKFFANYEQAFNYVISHEK